MPSRKPLLAIGGALFAAAIVVVGIGVVVTPSGDNDSCPPPAEGRSVARHWNESLLDAVRRDVPAPTVHARNLFHTSAAMWDAWAAYDSDATGVFVDEDAAATDVAAARDEAISYAAFRVLESRYIDSIGAVDSITQFDDLMAMLCYPIDVTRTEGDTPAALGNRIAAAIIEAGLEDGSNEAEGYVDPSYAPANDPLIVAASGAALNDPNRWQPLQLERMVSQNGIPVENAQQEFVDPHWGGVAGFALPAGGAAKLPINPGPPPYLGDPESDAEFKDAAVEVIHYSSLLDPGDDVSIDISPGAMGANPLGSNDGVGHTTNPVSGRPYRTNVVNQADYGRAVAEFWADGPASETPPGHWNTLANHVSDEMDPELRIGGVAEPVDRLEWDVKLYLALNAANHDAAVAAWGAKGYYDYVRPISMIRSMGGLGQSSDPDADAYHPDGLPLVPGLIEVATDESTATGERHEALAGHEGEVMILAWTGPPKDPETESGGVAWIHAVDWVPYQQATFVTPAFAGYVSGHSAFSRASAEVLSGFTGNEFFPGGLGEWTIAAGSLEFEAGPENAVTLQWATYADAADQAGRSRLYGGIHVRADDVSGRLMGADIGRAAWERAQRYYVGSTGG